MKEGKEKGKQISNQCDVNESLLRASEQQACIPRIDDQMLHATAETAVDALIRLYVVTQRRKICNITTNQLQKF